MASESHLPLIPLQTLLVEHMPLIIAFKIACTSSPAWAICLLIDHRQPTDDEPLPKLLKVRTEELSSYEALEKLIPKHLLYDDHTSWLTKSAQLKNVCVVVSTKSGTGLASNFYFSILKPLLSEFGLEQNQNFELHMTNSDSTVRDLAGLDFYHNASFNYDEHGPGNEQNIILLSGDGGVSDIVNGLLTGKIPNKEVWQPPVINLIPLGTGNALANSSGIIGRPGDKTVGLRSLVCGHPQGVPIFKATFTGGSAHIMTNEGTTPISLQRFFGTGSQHIYGAVVFSWGLHATLVADSDTKEWRTRGDARFAEVAKNLLDPPHIYRGRLGIREATDIMIYEHGYLLATFCSKLDANFMVSPRSQPLDGRLRLVQFGPKHNAQDIWRLLGNGQRLCVEDQAVMYREIERVSLQLDEDDERWRRVCVDGHIILVDKIANIICEKYEGDYDVVRLRVLGGS